MRILIATTLAFALAAGVGCEKKQPGGQQAAGKFDAGPTDAPPDVAAPPADAEKTPSGLAHKQLRAGTGTERPEPQDTVTVNYTGWTTDGKKFDSSYDRKRPATFALRGVIPGWTEGLQLMVKGEKRRFWIPVELAYRNQPGKPAGMLVFDVELMDIKKGPKPIPAPADVAGPPADAAKTNSGMFHKVVTAGTGTAKPSANAQVEFHYTAWSSDGKMIETSTQRNRPLNIPLAKGLPVWQEGIQLMVAGEKRRFWVPQEMGFKGRPGTATGLTVFDIELLSFVEPPPVPTDVAAPPKGTQKTPSGIHSKLLKKGTGKQHPTADSVVEVHYSGWTTDGKMFDSSVTRGKPTQFPLRGVIPGWTEGVQLMVEGEKRRFWIPEELAYKGQPPKGMLVFDIELLRIVK